MTVSWPVGQIAEIDWNGLAAVATERLESLHFDGQGCGTHGSSGCGHCYGPSPASAAEVVQAVFGVIGEAAESVSERPKASVGVVVPGGGVSSAGDSDGHAGGASLRAVLAVLRDALDEALRRLEAGER